MIRALRSRVLDPVGADSLAGTDVPELTPNLDGSGDEPLVVLDEATLEPVLMVTRLPAKIATRLRWAVTTLDIPSRGRRTARTFGWTTKRPVNRRETCRACAIAASHPGQHAALVDVGAALSRDFDLLLPERAAADREIASVVGSDWRLRTGAAWTSGIVNRSNQLRYHRDRSNLPTWSAMPVLRYGVRGGHLHLPEYDTVVACRDSDVVWFCGRDLLHGVTPFTRIAEGADRYSVVYYALAGMKNCGPRDDEIAASATLRTERERSMAARDRP